MAKRRSIYDSTYQTPLADFLEQIPQYYLQLQQLNDQREKYASEKAYRESRDRESDRRWKLTQQEKIKNQRLSTAKVALTQQLNDSNTIPVKSRKDWINNVRHQYSEFPELLAIIDSRVSALDPYIEADKSYREIDAEISEMNTLSTDDSFGSHFNRQEKRNELVASGKNLAEGSGTKAMIDNEIAVLDKTLKFEKDNAGKRKPDAQWSREDLKEFNRADKLVDAGNIRVSSINKEIIEKQAKLDSLGEWKNIQEMAPARALRNEIVNLNNELSRLQTYEDKNSGKIVRGSIDKNREIMRILEQRNSYPELSGTSKILEGGVSGYEPKEEMNAPDVERYILNNPEEGFDSWLEFISNPSEETENKFNLGLNEFIESENNPPPSPSQPKVVLPDTVKDAVAVIDAKKQGIVPDFDLAKTDDDLKPDEDKGVKIPSVLGGLQAQDKKEPIGKTISTEQKVEKPKGKYGSADGALSDVYDKMVQIRKFETPTQIGTKYGDHPQDKKNLKASEKLRKQLKKDILSIYNPETREFRYPGYAETFSPKGDVVMSLGKPKQLDTRNVAGGWSGRRRIPVGDIMSFIEELFPPVLAST